MGAGMAATPRRLGVCVFGLRPAYNACSTSTVRPYCPLLLHHHLHSERTGRSRKIERTRTPRSSARTRSDRMREERAEASWRQEEGREEATRRGTAACECECESGSGSGVVVVVAFGRSRKPQAANREPRAVPLPRRNRADDTGSEVLLFGYINIGVPTPRRCRCVRCGCCGAHRE
jgi:hypothetical protein